MSQARRSPKSKSKSKSKAKAKSQDVEDTRSVGGHGGCTLMSTVIGIVFAFRLVNALQIYTFFQPDEYFQSLEPAWQIAFGEDSGAWITWEWTHHLRSSLHPYLFAVVYRIVDFIAQLLHLSPSSRAALLISSPKLVQGVISGIGDYFTFKFAGKINGNANSLESLFALLLAVFNPWQWFCSTRTFSNSLETTLTIVALYLWPWHWAVSTHTPNHNDIRKLRRCLLVAALACVLRPTNVLIWLYLFFSLVIGTLARDWYSPLLLTKTSGSLIVLIREICICGSAILSLSVLTDRIYYGTWVLPPIKFLYFNVVQSLAVFYGRNDWHYYLSQGYPLLLTTALPFAIIGIFQSLCPRATGSDSQDLQSRIKSQLSVICILMPAVLSLIKHKEVRFIYPLLPSLHILAAAPAAKFFGPTIFSSARSQTPRRLLLLFLILTNLSISIYTGAFHASGVLKVLDYLRERQIQKGTATCPSVFSKPDRIVSANYAKCGITAGFLMPCHSTPWRSHLIFPSIQAWALTCDPPVNLSDDEKAQYLDEADQFYDNPTEFLRNNMIGGLKDISPKPFPSSSIDKHPWPEYLIFFSQLEPTLRSALRSSNYAECYRTFNTAWHDDWRRKGDIIVWCTDPAEQQKWRIQTAVLEGVSEKQKQQKHFDRMIDRFSKDVQNANKWWKGSGPHNVKLKLKPGKSKHIRPHDISSLLLSPSSWEISLPSKRFWVPSWARWGSLDSSYPSWPSVRWPWSNKPNSKRSWEEMIVSVWERFVPNRQGSSDHDRRLWS